MTGTILQTLLSRAQYSTERQSRALQFYLQVVIPNLGPGQDLDMNQNPWPSFMTDDFSPLEFSWNWGSLRSPVAPTIRVSFEAIGAQAKTSTDPWNSASTLNLLANLQATTPNVDLYNFEQLSPYLLPDSTITIAEPPLEVHGYQSSLFLAAEFVSQEPTIKVYWLPLLKALQTSQSVSAIICQALRSLAVSLEGFSAIHQLVDFLENKAPSLGLQPFIVATDCITVSKSRIKVYARCQETSFASVEAMMSLFDKNQNISKGIRELRDLWKLTLVPDEDFCATKDLPSTLHVTAGMLYYFEANPNSNQIATKVYLPMKHYGKNDQAVAMGLATFLNSRGSHYTEHIKGYMKALDDICTYRSLSSASGLQNYISCCIKDGSLELTSYLSPEIFHSSRARK
jgi:DMATS type aromatic prenyltransferase